jgi:M3 family oligoendopeptidase
MLNRRNEAGNFAEYPAVLLRTFEQIYWSFRPISRHPSIAEDLRMTYKHYPERAETLTKEFVESEYKKLTGSIEAAEASESAELWLALYAGWNALKSYVSSEGSRVNYAQSKDMSDPVLEEAERYYREDVTPVSDDASSKLVNALINSKHKQDIAARYGSFLIRALETEIEPLAPINSALRVKDGDLGNRYDKLVSSGEVTVDGKQVTLAVARAMQSSGDVRIRTEAFTAYRAWFIQHHDELASIFDEMVHLRDQMGRNLGHKNFIPLGYLGMSRTDYGPKESEAFRASVLKYAVPLQSKIYELHAEELGADTLKPWDAGYTPSLTLPQGIAPVGTQLEKAQKVFDAISPRLGGHFRRMVGEGLIDLENRPNKYAGAFCTTFSDEGRAAILCNSTGDEDDVGTLMHEMGHAFQAWESSAIESVDLQRPTFDVAEVHSMGMEYLSMKEMSHFFSDENAEKVRRGRWREAVEILCYIGIVDEFQHWVYENPNCTTKERDQAWSKIWDIYKPGIDFTGMEDQKIARWYAQGHIFRAPFYYIDYAIAETGAMQLALMDASDKEKALGTYLKLCQMGGRESVLTIFKSSGLRSPFDPKLMQELMEHAASELGVKEFAEV